MSVADLKEGVIKSVSGWFRVFFVEASAEGRPGGWKLIVLRTPLTDPRTAEFAEHQTPKTCKPQVPVNDAGVPMTEQEIVDLNRARRMSGRPPLGKEAVVAARWGPTRDGRRAKGCMPEPCRCSATAATSLQTQRAACGLHLAPKQARRFPMLSHTLPHFPRASQPLYRPAPWQEGTRFFGRRGPRGSRDRGGRGGGGGGERPQPGSVGGKRWSNPGQILVKPTAPPLAPHLRWRRRSCPRRSL